MALENHPLNGKIHEKCPLLRASHVITHLLIALLNLYVLGFSFVVFHDKAKRTQQGNLITHGRVEKGLMWHLEYTSLKEISSFANLRSSLPKKYWEHANDDEHFHVGIRG